MINRKALMALLIALILGGVGIGATLVAIAAHHTQGCRP